MDFWSFCTRLTVSPEIDGAEPARDAPNVLDRIEFPSRAFASFYRGFLAHAIHALPGEAAAPNARTVAKTAILDFLARTSCVREISLSIGGEHPLERRAPLLSTHLDIESVENQGDVLCVLYGGYHQYRRVALAVVNADLERGDCALRESFSESTRPGSRLYSVSYATDIATDVAVASFSVLVSIAGTPRVVLIEGDGQAARRTAATIRRNYGGERVLEKSLSSNASETLIGLQLRE